jgi:UDP-N-acetylglucosamine 2-epimerase (non-hydrolysing)/UDP-GlcNAc3NAcA epimerase
LLCPTEAAMENLKAEGLAERARLVGDPMADLALELGPLAEARSDVLARLDLVRGEYLVATLHRAGNVDEERLLARAVELLFAVGEQYGPVVVPLHPRTHVRLEETGLDKRLRDAPHVRLVEPLGYLDFSCLLRGSRAVLTDSGGVQKEAYLAGVPCVTLRAETEWVETAESGWNRLVGLDLKLALTALDGLFTRLGPPPDPALYAAGEAGERCVEALLEWAASAS